MSRLRFRRLTVISALTLVLVWGQAIAQPKFSRSALPGSSVNLSIHPPIDHPIHSAVNPLVSQNAQQDISQDALAEGDRLFQTGLDQFNQQQIDAAIATWQTALEAYQNLLPSDALNDTPETSEAELESEFPSEFRPVWNAIAATQQNLLAAYLQQNRLNDAIALLPVQAKIQQRLGRDAAAATAHYTLAGLYAQQGRYRAALAPYERSLAYAETQGSERLPIVLGNLAIAYRNTGQFLKALQANRRAIEQLQIHNNLPLLRRVLGNQGNVYQSLGRYRRAKEHFEQGLQLAEQLGDRPGQALLWNSLGGVAMAEADYPRATTAYRKSIRLAEDSGSIVSLGSAWLNLGDVEHQQGHLTEAIAYYEKSLAIAEQLNKQRDHSGGAGSPPRLMAEALGSLGVAYSSQGNSAQAVAKLRQSLEISEASGDRVTRSTTLNNLGHTLYEAGRLAEAETTLRQALQVLDELRSGLSDLDKVSLFDTQAKTYLLLQQVLIAKQQPEAALEIAEWGRGRAFADLLAQRALDNSPGSARAHPGGAEAAIAQAARPPQLDELRQVARRAQATLVEYSFVPQDDFVHQGKQLGAPQALYIWVIQPNGQVHYRYSDLQPLLETQQSLAQIVQRSRCFAPAAICRRRLRTQQAAIQRSRSPIPAARSPAKSPADFKLIDPRFEGTETLRAAQGEPIDRQTRRFPALQQLHQILIEPIADLLPETEGDRVLFIPQGALFLVPFPALQTAEGQFLIEKYTPLTAPSIQTLILTDTAVPPSQQPPQQPIDPSEVLVVGNPTMPEVTLVPDRPAQTLTPLPGSEQEALAIAQTLGTAPLLGTQASEAAVVSRLPRSRWIHLATHGLLDYGLQTQQRIPGALALAPSPQPGPSPGQGQGSRSSAATPSNGLLTAEEIIDLDLQAELVVLSACDTGRGDLTGDGVVGLSRAWMAAGAPSLVVSLWAVSDESTAVLMQQFYTELSQGADKATALRRAMLSTAQSHPSPHDWAAFSLVGQAE